ncbi:MAG: hypothetical protein E4G99_11330 [Anaerolineales bacterium]|nr:MAG: hypothetical protein E4G99_11330 [Anaerolineales bacterium]
MANLETLTIIGSISLFAIGCLTLLTCRNLIQVIFGLQLLVKSAILLFIAAGSANGQLQVGQSLATTVIVADTIVAVIGIALAIQVRRIVGSLEINDLAHLRG